MNDINATVVNHRDITPYLSAVHGLTGCYTVATYFGTGKAKTLHITHALSYVGDTSRVLSQVNAQATLVILACYGQTKCTPLAEHATQCGQATDPSVAGAPTVVSLSPTNEAFCETVALAHIKEPTPLRMVPQHFDDLWKTGPKLFFISVTPRAPDALLKLVRCSCSSEIHRKTHRRGCNSAIVSGQCSVHVRVTEVVATNEQDIPFRHVTTTAKNQCISLVHSMHIYFNLHISNGPLHHDINFVTSL